MRVLYTAALAALLLITGCTRSQMERRAETRKSNVELEQEVKTRIASNATLASQDIKVSADAEKKQITLSGKVPTEELRMQAVAAAKGAMPGATVEDKIEVKPRELSRAEYTEPMAAEERERAKTHGEKIGTGLDDAWLHTAIAAKLLANPETPYRNINVDVENKTVTLRGEVDTAAAREEAGRIAKETEGVKAVKNQIKVQTPPSL